MSKHPSWVLLPLSLACACAFANTGDEGESQELNPVVVSGTPTGKANSVQFNPKTSIQPLPANDGASVLQSVPNMSIIRKGGSSGDPLLRGLGGSRQPHGSAHRLYFPRFFRQSDCYQRPAER